MHILVALAHVDRMGAVPEFAPGGHERITHVIAREGGRTSRHRTPIEALAVTGCSAFAEHDKGKVTATVSSAVHSCRRPDRFPAAGPSGSTAAPSRARPFLR